MFTLLERLFVEFPDSDWDYEALSSNPNITMDLIQNYPGKVWDYKALSKNPNLTMDFILNSGLPYENFDWIEISKNSSITMKDVVTYPQVPWDYYNMSENPNLTTKFIEAHLDLPWNFHMLSFHARLDVDFIKNHFNELNWVCLCSNKFITEEIVNRIPEGRWNLWNPYLTHHLNYVENYEDWFLPYIDEHVKIFEEHLLYKDKNFTCENLKCICKLNCDDIIKSYGSLIDIWTLISKNCGVKLKVIENYPECPWDYKRGVSLNPNLTMNFVKKYKDKLNFRFISKNQFKKDPDYKLPEISQQQCNLLNELIEKAWLPPKMSNLKVYKDGGTLFKEFADFEEECPEFFL
jgi:hypothetical protein